MKPEEAIHQALCNDDAALFRDTLQQHPELKARINDPLGPFDSPLLHSVRSREMLDVFLDAGADMNARSLWWAGGFGFLDTAPEDLAYYAIKRGATVDAHAASRLGLLDDLKQMIALKPAVVNARGGDGKTPLHFARNISVAEFLLDHGADINMRDIDHESTAAQYLIAERPEVVRYLVQRGCETDILIAAALGDVELARKHIDVDPSCVRLRVNDQCFPMKDMHAGGTIYNWTLGWHVSPQQVAKKFGHDEVLHLLIERSPADVRLINACWMGDEREVGSVLTAQPDISSKLKKEDHQQIAHAARNNDLNAVRLMLEAGLPLDARGQHGGTPLHWAAWHGNAPMTAELLNRKPPLELTDWDFKGTPLVWVMHGSENGWHKSQGDYGAVARQLLEAGTRIPENVYGTEAVRSALANWKQSAK